MTKFDDSEYDTVVFDEIVFHNTFILRKIKRYCENNPEKIIIATGDTNQLETVDITTNTQDKSNYTDRCIDLIFKNRMHFKENKRLKSQQDKNILKQFKQDIFNKTINIEGTVQKYFKIVKDNKTNNNIAYRNKTCQVVAHKVRSRLGKRDDVEKNEVLVCRKFFKSKRVTFTVNYEYTVTKILDN